MYKTVEGVYEDGKITLKESHNVTRSRVMVTFLDETDSVKIFTEIPDIFKNPINVQELKEFNREELHER